MVGVLPKRRILMRYESRRGTWAQQRTPPHPTTTFSQWRKAWPRPSAPTSTSAAWWVAMATPLTGKYSSTCPPMHTPNWCFTSSNSISWRKGSSGWREESRVRERDFGNFQVGERMKVIKEIHKLFERFFYQEGNFNFSPFRMKLKFHIFSCLKLYFKISKF